MSAVVPSYTGQNQPTQIQVPAKIAYKYIDPEEGAWSMPAYSGIFDYSSQGDPIQLIPPEPSYAPPSPTPWIKPLATPPPVPWIKQIPITQPPLAKAPPDQIVIQATSVMPPYQNFFPTEGEGSTALVPPPVQKTDIFSAMQTWPL